MWERGKNFHTGSSTCRMRQLMDSGGRVMDPLSITQTRGMLLHVSDILGMFEHLTPVMGKGAFNVWIDFATDKC